MYIRILHIHAKLLFWTTRVIRSLTKGDLISLSSTRPEKRGHTLSKRRSTLDERHGLMHVFPILMFYYAFVSQSAEERLRIE